jgi:DNA repair protein RecO (recombination protein O)
VTTAALVVRRVPIGEADLLVHLFTKERGLLTTSARSARRASSKLGALEPIHTLEVVLELAARSDIAKLKEARISTARIRILGDERRLDAAARLLRWIRSSTSASPEPEVFAAALRLLDALDAPAGPSVLSGGLLVRAGLELLAGLGYSLDLAACVRCGTPCPEGASALVDPMQGGLVCRACGGARVLLKAPLRHALDAAGAGAVPELADDDVASAVALIEEALMAHTGRRLA